MMHQKLVIILKPQLMIILGIYYCSRNSGTYKYYINQNLDVTRTGMILKHLTRMI